MNEKQAEDVILAIEQTWECKIEDEVRPMWVKAMLPHDSLMTATAILKLSDRQKDRPTIADIRKVVVEMIAAEAPLPEPVYSASSGKGAPEWTSVWFWMRFKLRDFRTLPQQDPYEVSAATKEPAMTVTEYEDMRDKWIQDGSPKVNPQRLVQGLGGVLGS